LTSTILIAKFQLAIFTITPFIHSRSIKKITKKFDIPIFRRYHWGFFDNYIQRRWDWHATK